MAEKLTKREFIERAKSVHGNTYDYSKVHYVNAHVNIVIICPRHGEFVQEPTNHIYVGQGCPICARGGTNDERFDNFVVKGNPEECWQWTGNKSHNGYGRFWIENGTVAAHRYAYERYISDIPEGMFVLHHCDNPECTNPQHLFVGSLADNMQDMVQKGRCADQRGESNPGSKLTSDDVRAMREFHKVGKYTQKQIGERFGVALSTANQIINRKRWDWLND